MLSLLAAADKEGVASRRRREQGRFADWQVPCDRAHFESVGEDDASEAEPPPQQVRHDRARKGGWCVRVEGRIENVRGHQGGDPCCDRRAERDEFPGEKEVSRRADHRQFLVGVSLRRPVAGEVLSDGDDSLGEGAARPSDAEGGGGGGVVRNGAVADDRVARVAVHVENGREVDVNSHGGDLGGRRRAGRPGGAQGACALQSRKASRRREGGEGAVAQSPNPPSFLVYRDERQGSRAFGRFDFAA